MSTNEKQVEAQQEAQIVAEVPAVDCFGHIYVGDRGVDLHVETMKQYAFKNDHEHCKKVVTGEDIEDLNLYALTQSFKTECGMELMKKLIASGQASPEDFEDTGTLGGDDTLPRDINTLVQEVSGESRNLDAVLQQFGGNLNGAVNSEDVEKYINGLIEAKLAAAQKAQEIPSNE